MRTHIEDVTIFLRHVKAEEPGGIGFGRAAIDGHLRADDRVSTGRYYVAGEDDALGVDANRDVVARVPALLVGGDEGDRVHAFGYRQPPLHDRVGGRAENSRPGAQQPTKLDRVAIRIVCDRLDRDRLAWRRNLNAITRIVLGDQRPDSGRRVVDRQIDAVKRSASQVRLRFYLLNHLAVVDTRDQGHVGVHGYVGDQIVSKIVDQGGVSSRIRRVQQAYLTKNIDVGRGFEQTERGPLR